MAGGISTRRRCLAALGLALVILILALSGGSAGAAGLSAKKAQAAALEVQVATLKARANAANSSWLLAERKLDAARHAVQKSQTRLARSRWKLEAARNTVAARAAAMYKRRSVNVVDVLLGSDDFGELASQARLMALLSDYDHDVLVQMRRATAEVRARHQQLMAAREAARLLAQQRRQESVRTVAALAAGRQTLSGLRTEIVQLRSALPQPVMPSAPAVVSAATAATGTAAAPKTPSSGWCPLISAAAAANGISARGLYNLMMIESGGIQTIVGGQFCGLFQYWRPVWQASWNPYRAASIFDGSAQIKATALAIGMGKGPSWWPGSYQRAFSGT